MTNLSGQARIPALVLHRVVSPIAIALLFFGVVTPIAFILRLLGKDLLALKRDPEAKTYWIERLPRR